MKFSEVFQAKNIIAEVKATRKSDVIAELVQKMVDSGSLDADGAEDVVRALVRREELGSTGIGNGIAVPHAKRVDVDCVIGVLGRSREGVDFGALDGLPVHLFFMIVSSPDAVEPHLEALKKVTTVLRDLDFCAFLKRAKDEVELADLLVEAEDRLAKL